MIKYRIWMINYFEDLHNVHTEEQDRQDEVEERVVQLKSYSKDEITEQIIKINYHIFGLEMGNYGF